MDIEAIQASINKTGYRVKNYSPFPAAVKKGNSADDSVEEVAKRINDIPAIANQLVTLKK